MERINRKRTALLSDLKRLVSPWDVLYTVGNLVYRRSLRYTVFTVGVSVLGVLANALGYQGLSVKTAVLLPLIVGGIALLGGTLLKVLPSPISSRLLTVAQASDLNLMEDYRKSQADQHLDALWHRMFSYECQWRIAAGLPALVGMKPPEGACPVTCLHEAKQEFLSRARLALATPQPQIRQMFTIGLDLRAVEDWRDGAWFDRSDTKLVEQFEGSATLLAARRDVGMAGLGYSLRTAAGRTAQRFWFSVLTRMLAMQVGLAVESLNEQFDTDVFDAEVLLWPGEEDADWVRQYDGARQAVLDRRARVLRRVFGPDFASACEVLDHMLYPSFAAACELRMRYDPEYCDERMGYDVMSDLAEEGRCCDEEQRARRYVARAVRGREAMAELLEKHRSDLLADPQAEALRAVLIALHVDWRGLRTRLWAHVQADRNAAPPAELLAMVDRAVELREGFSRRLLAIRMHHELTRLARSGYRELVRRLAYA